MRVEKHSPKAKILQLEPLPYEVCESGVDLKVVTGLLATDRIPEISSWPLIENPIHPLFIVFLLTNFSKSAKKNSGPFGAAKSGKMPFSPKRGPFFKTFGAEGSENWTTYRCQSPPPPLQSFIPLPIDP